MKEISFTGGLDINMVSICRMQANLLLMDTCMHGASVPLTGCERCPQGMWCMSGVRVNCTVGFYNPLRGQADATACIRCPPNSATQSEESTDIASSFISFPLSCGDGFFGACHGLMELLRYSGGRIQTEGSYGNMNLNPWGSCRGFCPARGH